MNDEYDEEKQKSENHKIAKNNVDLIKKSETELYKAKYSDVSLKIENNDLIRDNDDTQKNNVNYYYLNDNQKQIENKIYANQKKYNSYDIVQRSDEASQNLNEYFDNSFYSSGTNFNVFSTKLLTVCSIFVVNLLFITVII